MCARDTPPSIREREKGDGPNSVEGGRSADAKTVEPAPSGAIPMPTPLNSPFLSRALTFPPPNLPIPRG
jgi:hypothetical protein